MSGEHPTVRQVDWRSLLPALLLFRAFRVAIHPAALALATTGLLVSLLGWQLGSWLFLEDGPTGRVAHVAPPMSRGPTLPAEVSTRLPAEVAPVPTGYLDVWWQFAAPVAQVLRADVSLREVAYCVWGALWSLAVWALCGAAISRLAVVQIGFEQPAGLFDSLGFIFTRYFACVTAPLYPLLGVYLLGLLLVPLGWLMNLDAGVLVAGIVWVFALLLGIAAAWLLTGALLGWPLMWPAISAERDGDAFEALSRSFAYAFQRPHLYVGYVLALTLLGVFGTAAVDWFAGAVVEFAWWAVSWGAGGERIAMIRAMAEGTAPRQGSLGAGAALAGLAIWLWYAVAIAFRYSYFFAGSAAIYLLLRLHVDHKELDEVFIPGEEPRIAPPPPPPAAAAPAPAPANLGADDVAQ